MFFLSFIFSIAVSAEEVKLVHNDVSENETQLNTNNVEKNDLNNSNTFEVVSNEKIETLIEENKQNQKTIEQYQSLYSTWTIILTALLTVFGIFIPIALPFIIDKINRHKLNEQIAKLQHKSEEQYKKMILIQNALALSSFEDYWASNECLRKLQEKYPDDEYIKIYIARNSFRELCNRLDSDNGHITASEDTIYETINTFIDWFYETDGSLLDELLIGSVFNNSTVHEVCILIGYLNKCDNLNAQSNFIKICKKSCKYILDTFKIKDYKELFDYEQTDVFIINYKQLNFYLCEAYYKNKNHALKEQLDKTIQLYNVDDFSRQDDNLKRCTNMLDEINKSIGNNI